MKKRFKESKYYEDWLLKAKRDLDTAFLNHRHGGYTDTTCYFCHQTVEKALKSYLLYKGLRFLPQTHILPSLLSLCEEKDKYFAKFREKCQILDGYYIETKYPVSPPCDYSKDQTEEAIEIAEQIFDFVNEKMGKRKRK
ncbi:HEPN domain-containing protein [Candidatus Gottesmanbacteria bacterium]|nr:HEPN domain-containing protein [Candidatus Gottesmanbacteria bacterium]